MFDGSEISIKAANDTFIQSPSAGQTLVYDSDSAKWRNAAGASGNSDAVSVDDYGAVANGQTDDTAAIAAAITAAAGRRVVLGRGREYAVNSLHLP